MKKHLTIKGKCAIIYESSGHLGVAQLVARYLGVVEAAGSSPVTQTKKTLKTLSFQGLFSILLRKILRGVTQFATRCLFCHKILAFSN